LNQGRANTDQISGIADALFDSELTRRPMEPLTDTNPGLSLDDAYQIQQWNVARRLAAGELILGHKIGLTAKAMQEKFGVNEPDFGHLLDSMFLERDTPLNLAELIDPQVEIEPAFVLGRELAGPEVSAADVLAATDYISVCFEIIDSRFVDWRIKLQDTVADNGSSARVILSDRKVKPAGLALDNLEAVLELDGAVVATANTNAILGHPANGVAWLANYVSRFGVVLEAGHVVLPGTCTRSFRIGSSRRVSGRIAGLGELSLALEGAPSNYNPGQE
jgi:2-keto-4-pentenoate hydratase